METCVPQPSTSDPVSTLLPTPLWPLLPRLLFSNPVPSPALTPVRSAIPRLTSWPRLSGWTTYAELLRTSHILPPENGLPSLLLLLLSNCSSLVWWKLKGFLSSSLSPYQELKRVLNTVNITLYLKDKWSSEWLDHPLTWGGEYLGARNKIVLWLQTCLGISFAAPWLGDLDHVTSLLCASVFSSLKWEQQFLQLRIKRENP